MTRTGESDRIPPSPARFGVPQLDRIWRDVPQAGRILFVSDPGIEGDPFLYQAARHHLEEGRNVVIVVTDRPPTSAERGLLASGCQIDAHAGRLHFVDAYSPLFGIRSTGRYTVPRPDDLETWGAVLNHVASEHPDSVLLVDALSAIADQVGVDRFLNDLPLLTPAFDQFRFTGAFFTAWPYRERLERLFSNFDAVVSLHAVQERVVMGRSFHVERADWVQHLDNRPRLYKALVPEGVVVYIPKIVVTGPFNAGKSTFVRTVSDNNVSVDRMGTTVALDHGSVMLDGLRAEVFGTPGQSRFDPILKIVAGQALGVVVLVDSTKPDSIPRAKEMMEMTWRKGLPVIIAANKQDATGALTPEEIAQRLAVPRWIQVVGCSAQDPESSRRVLTRLIDAIMGPRSDQPPGSREILAGGERA